MRTKKENNKTEFVRLRIDSVEKNRLEKLCDMTRRQKSDIVRESLFELYKLIFFRVLTLIYPHQYICIYKGGFGGLSCSSTCGQGVFI